MTANSTMSPSVAALWRARIVTSGCWVRGLSGCGVGGTAVGGVGMDAVREGICAEQAATTSTINRHPSSMAGSARMRTDMTLMIRNAVRSPA